MDQNFKKHQQESPAGNARGVPVRDGRYPDPVLDRVGVTHPVLMDSTLDSPGQGAPYPVQGYPHLGLGYPLKGHGTSDGDGVSPCLGLGYPPQKEHETTGSIMGWRWGIALHGTGVAHGKDMGKV